MFNKYMKNGFLGLAILSLLFLFVVTPGFALGRPFNNNNLTPTVGQNGKLRACQARENAIKTRISHLSLLATTMESKFDKIAQRVEDYYTNKVVPSGKTVSNFNNLVADTTTKKVAVDAAIKLAQTDVDNFTCTSTNPKANLVQFRTDMQNVKTALKSYRTSIKNLIVAVRSVTGQENKVTKTPTPTP